MATASSTRPPTSTEASDASQAEGVRDVPSLDMADWADALPGELPESGMAAQAPAEPETAVSPEEAGPPVQTGPPRVEPSPSEQLHPPTEAGTPPRVEGNLPSVLGDPGHFTSHPSTLPLRGSKTPPPETPLPVLLLIDQARSASGEERQELSRRINRWLDQMVREGGSRHVADWFHHLIESERLEGLADAAGQACHETAIQGLLAMGYPYALEVRPEDLERIKPREVREQGQEKDVKRASAGILAGGILTELVLDLLRTHPLSGLLTVEVGVSLLAMVAILFGTPRGALRNMGLAVLLVVSVVSVFLGVFTGYAGLVSGLAGLLAVLLFALHRS